jgi:hypothetical protein
MAHPEEDPVAAVVSMSWFLEPTRICSMDGQWIGMSSTYEIEMTMEFFKYFLWSQKEWWAWRTHTHTHTHTHAHGVEQKCTHKSGWKSWSKEREDPGIDVRMILNMIFRKWDGRVLTGFICFLWLWWWTLRFHKMSGTFWPVEGLLGSEAGLCSLELLR